ncbi:putative reverse transcriptase domain-containing protein [Tanacetum coccineum]|uniref:Reverse transcriptase domain-containing protein n=1 Tax=Tanacetum coccineum TaxID=301880 RepID=A0ABQ5A979_9ASTR
MFHAMDNVNFEIKSQFTRELCEDTFLGNKNDDAHKHVERVLDIRWIDMIPSGTINTWDLLKKAFIQRYCSPSKTVKKIEEIHNFKQEGDETLYQAWERTGNKRRRSGSSDGITVAEFMEDHILTRNARSTKKLRELKKSSMVNLEDIFQTMVEMELGTLTKEVQTRVTREEIGHCKAIFTNKGLHLYTPFDYSLEELDYFSSKSYVSDEET